MLFCIDHNPSHSSIGSGAISPLVTSFSIKLGVFPVEPAAPAAASESMPKTLLSLFTKNLS
jgi:hypothetical protein